MEHVLEPKFVQESRRGQGLYARSYAMMLGNQKGQLAAPAAWGSGCIGMLKAVLSTLSKHRSEQYCQEFQLGVQALPAGTMRVMHHPCAADRSQPVHNLLYEVAGQEER